MEEIHPHHHHPYHQDIRSNSVVNKLHSTNNNNNNNNNILSSSMASMASLAASVGMSIPQHHHQHLPSVVPSNHHHHPQQQQQQQQQHQQQPVIISHLCAGCGQLIKDRYLLQALESYWHEDCLKCSCCGCRLGEVGSNLFTKANLILCKRDYLRLFGATGNCAACCKPIPAFEMVMRAKSNVYHLDCFACQQCHQRFCVGDRFYLCDNQILCEYDYEERLIFANLATSSSSTNSGCQQQQQQQQQQPAQPFNNRAALLPPSGVSTSPSHRHPSSSTAEESTSSSSSNNITARIIWNHSTSSGTSPSFMTGDVDPATSDNLSNNHPSVEDRVVVEPAAKQESSSSPLGGGAGQQPQQQQQQQQNQVVEHDASSSGYGSPDSGGLIDEG